MDFSSDLLRSATIHFGAHWSSREDRSSAHLNLFVPEDFLPSLVGEYSARFVRSVSTCTGLLSKPLFGGKGGERLTLSTDIGGIVPLKYHLIRENELPFPSVIDGLGEAFERFVRSFAAGPGLPVEEEWRDYGCVATIEYRHLRTNADMSLDLRLGVPPAVTEARFGAFRSRALSGLEMSQEGGRHYPRFPEDPSAVSNRLFDVRGECFGAVSLTVVTSELHRLFEYAAADLGY